MFCLVQFPGPSSIMEGDQLPEALTAVVIIDLLEKAKSPFSKNVSIPDAV